MSKRLMTLTVACILATSLQLVPTSALAQESSLDALIQNTQETITKIETAPIPVVPQGTDKPSSKKTPIDIPNLVDERIKSAQDEDNKKKSKTVDAKYARGAELLSSVHGSTSTVLLITQLLNTESGINKTTNIWRDEDFRNTYDSIRNWGTVVGTVATVAGGIIAATSDTPEARKAGSWTIAGGAGVVGLSQLAGIIWGNESGDKMKEKAQFIELTRRAYDDLALRVDMVEALEASNAQFQQEVEAFQLNYKNLDSFKTESEKLGRKEVPVAELQGRALDKLAAIVNRFLVVVGQIDQILNSYEVLVNKYDNPDPKKEYPVVKVKEDMQKLRNKLRMAKENYQKKVKPFLERNGEIVAVFGGI